MPSYEYKCQKCDFEFEEFLPMSEYDKAQKCPECGSMRTSKIFTSCNFVLKGGGWTGRDLKFKNDKSWNNKILDKKQNERRQDDTSIPKLAPNVDGERTSSWKDAQKLAKSKGKSTASYEPLVRKEKSKG